MKGQNKNRKQPTCSRCRFHGKKDIRVLQHQCPYKSCTCDSCVLIKRRSIIYRAQKNLDRQDDNSNERPSSPSSASTVSSSGGGGNGCIGSLSPHLLPGGQSSSSVDSGHLSGPTGSSNGSSSRLPPVLPSMAWNHGSVPPPPLTLHHHQHQNPSNQLNFGGGPPALVPGTGVCGGDAGSSGYAQRESPRRISDFQTLCLNFPDLSPAQLQTLFEQSGSDFQRTIDRILMNKWYNNEAESQKCVQPPSSVASNAAIVKNEPDRSFVVVNNGYHEVSNHATGAPNSLLTHYNDYTTSTVEYNNGHANSSPPNASPAYHHQNHLNHYTTYPTSNSCDWSRSRLPPDNDYYYYTHDGTGSSSCRTVSAAYETSAPSNCGGGGGGGYEQSRVSSNQWHRQSVAAANAYSLLPQSDHFNAQGVEQPNVYAGGGGDPSSSSYWSFTGYEQSTDHIGNQSPAIVQTASESQSSNCDEAPHAIPYESSQWNNCYPVTSVLNTAGLSESEEIINDYNGATNSEESDSNRDPGKSIVQSELDS